MPPSLSIEFRDELHIYQIKEHHQLHRDDVGNQAVCSTNGKDMVCTGKELVT